MFTDELLKDVRKSNPEMTRERLISGLSVSRYSTSSLLNTFEKSEQKK